MKNKTTRIAHHCTCPGCRADARSPTAKEHRVFNRVLRSLDEKSRRQVVGFLALHWGRGGIARVREISGLSRPTIRRVRDEVQRPDRTPEPNRVRRVGAGRPRVEKNTRNS